MTRTAPYLTLGAVAVLGGGLFLANGIGAPAPAAPVGATPVVAAVPAAPPPADAPVLTTVPGPAAAPVRAEPAPAAPATDWAGGTDDGDMTVAIAVRGDEATAYVCGAGLEVWLRGLVSPDGELDLVSASGRSTLTGTGEAGEVVTDGAERTYTADAVDVDEAVAGGRDDVGEVAERAGGSGY